ncbi:hypothetical protein C8A00DRAFT_19483 [Chaetomidium leptoderma]|uniref:Uncharacterized protein n=1 Tax=Chaetomidium leptoderma TaxID=669021 RepID=A0AAN6VC80_9PEZI|nr:hypothetical protein C8A00DRAFT_19483 [Chaetomidium leptoderma]
MAVTLVIEPSDFVLPPGPRLVVIRVDRDALRHFAPSMDPLTDADSFTRVLRKGKAALEHIRRDVSIKLFGADLPCSIMRMGWPQPEGSCDYRYAAPLQVTRYVGFSFTQDISAGELDAAVVELTSESAPIDNCIRFHVIEDHENRKGLHLEQFNRDEVRAVAVGEASQGAL